LLAHEADHCDTGVGVYRGAGYDDLEYSDHPGARAGTGTDPTTFVNGSDNERGCNDFNVGFIFV
jgi:hypothetical protein